MIAVLVMACGDGTEVLERVHHLSSGTDAMEAILSAGPYVRERGEGMAMPRETHYDDI